MPGSNLAASELPDRYCSAILFGSMEDDSKEELGFCTLQRRDALKFSGGCFGGSCSEVVLASAAHCECG
jgi:hypothetical protein